jgi:hypothetical protein
MGEMISLKDLNVRRNQLQALPDGKMFSNFLSFCFFKNWTTELAISLMFWID